MKATGVVVRPTALPFTNPFTAGPLIIARDRSADRTLAFANPLARMKATGVVARPSALPFTNPCTADPDIFAIQLVNRRRAILFLCFHDMPPFSPARAELAGEQEYVQSEMEVQP
jgi:hypothetical protein